MSITPKITKVTPEVGVASVQKTWQFAQQLVQDKSKHPDMAERLAAFFTCEMLRIKEEQS